MEPHPVPQNITSFEFHLVGDMTLKQFGYLGGGAAIAYFIFILIYPLSPIIAVPLIAFFTLIGAALAFLPILDRPLDHWIKAYFKAVYAPTQSFWQGEKDSNFQNRLNIYLASLQPVIPPSQPIIKPPLKLTRFIPTPTFVPTAPTVLPPTHSIPEARAHRDAPLQSNPSIPSTPPTQRAEHALPLQPIPPTISPTSPLQTTDYRSSIPRSLRFEELPTSPTPQVKIVEPLRQIKTQVVLTTFPNIINGIVTDAEGNYLEGVIVIIHNSDNIPVRALKTNKLGQFTGATPLPTGTYTITLEKDNLSFDNLQINLSDQVLPPINISAKRSVQITA